MGYDLHITRTADGTAEKVPITFKEWVRVVRSDPEMRLEGVAEMNTPDGVLRYENAGLAVWNEVWFDYRRGRIVVKNPSAAGIVKMKQLAAKLNAKVIGDEGEAY